MRINQVSILGSGVMGSQIATLFAGCGIPVNLYGFPHSSHPDESAQTALKKLNKLKPPPAFVKGDIDLVTPLDYERHLDELRHSDLVIEAIVEKLSVKVEMYNRVIPHLKSECILASNTSGILIQNLSAALPEKILKNFIGIHFFNPPRYTKLIELIASPGSDSETVDLLEQFLTTRLGKYVIRAHDSPAFIANRIGIFSLLSCAHQGITFKLSPDTIDGLTGPLIARSRSATFRTMDIVGLDICDSVAEGLKRDADDDPWRSHFKLPEWVRGLIEQGALGAKVGRGVYRKQGNTIEVWEHAKKRYRKASKHIDDKLRDHLKNAKSFAEVLLELREMRIDQAHYLWAIYCDMFQYAAWHADKIAPSLREIDLSWRLGFNAERGIFEIAQQAGWRQTVQAVEEAISEKSTLVEEPLPQWCKLIDSPYDSQSSYSPARQARVTPSTHPVYQRQWDPLTLYGEKNPYLERETIRESDFLRCADLGDGVAAVGFKTRMRVISFELINELHRLIDDLDETHHALVIWQGEGPFCAGANLYQILAGAKFNTIDQVAGWVGRVKQKTFEWLQPDLPSVAHLPPINEAIEALQSLHLKIRSCRMPVICAVRDLALGGGCELLMYSDRVVACSESYIGLVEIGVGLLPAGGGCAEMARRAALNAQDEPIFPYLARVFKDVATAFVAGSAQEALAHHFLRPKDVIIANPYELLYIAKRNALLMLEENYTPQPMKDIRVVGEMGKANLLAELNNLRRGNWISQHDYRCAHRIAHCICGGDVPENTRLPTEMMLKLEAKGFLELLGGKKTQERIKHTLMTGKPLRN